MIVDARQAAALANEAERNVIEPRIDAAVKEVVRQITRAAKTGDRAIVIDQTSLPTGYEQVAVSRLKQLGYTVFEVRSCVERQWDWRGQIKPPRKNMQWKVMW